MSRFIKGALLFVLIMGIAMLIPGFMENTTKASDEAEWSGDGRSEYDGFLILEIMPYKGMGELGYLVDGQEPVDDELFFYNSGPGYFSHVEGALKFFPSYVQKDIPSSGEIDYDWWPAITEVRKNGYFEEAGQGDDRYSVRENQTVYQPVAEGTGTHIAVLPANARLDKVYQVNYEPFMRQNVKAYFTSRIPEDESLLFSRTVKYKPYCVKASDDKTGDYDYDAERDLFILDPGKGSYDVIFEQDDNGKYYMLNNYKIVEDNSGEYSYADIRYVPQNGGNYIEITNGMTFEYQRWYGGNYKFVEDDTALTKPNFSKETVGGRTRIWVHGQKIMKRYQMTYKLGIVNNEWFKRFALEVPSEMANDYPVRVITVTPDELNANLHNEQDLIDQADLIYINAYEHDYLYIQLYEQFSYEGLALPSHMKYHNNNAKKAAELNFARHDINWTVTEKLFRKIAGIGCKKAAAIVDCAFYFQAVDGEGPYSAYYRNNSGLGANYSDWGSDVGATSINMAKLYIMIYQRNKIDFYNSFMNPDTTAEANRIKARMVATGVSPTGTTGSFIRPQASYGPDHNFALYWNGNTFLPWGLNADGVMVEFPQASFKDMGIFNPDMNRDKNNLTENVLTLYGDVGRIEGKRFIEAVTIPDKNGDGISETLPRFELTKIITGAGKGYGNTGGISYPGGGGVEGPPSTEVPDDPGIIPEDGSEGSNLRSYKRVLNIQPTAGFAQSEADIRSILAGYEVQIIHMTSTQFNSSLEDINSNYDMIFMGSGISGGVNYNRFPITGNKTDFNDDSLDSYVYLNQGDRMKLAGGSEPIVRYQSNDLTKQKVNELTDFLRAGYPIVLDSYLYGLTSPAGSVMSGTNIYSFITSSKGISSYRLLNLADCGGTAFKSRLKDGLEITKPRITLVSPDKSAGMVTETNELQLEFILYPWEDMRPYYRYNVFFYVDRNADGIFEGTDKINITSVDGSNWQNILLSTSSRRLKYKVTDLNGVYQWMLSVERADNPYIRANVKGYVSNTNKETLNILQIRDNSSTYNLKTNTENNLTTLIYQLAGEGKLSQYNLKFDSLTVSEYEALFAPPNTPYSSLNPEATGKLSKYHLLILDNPEDEIDDSYGAARNIRDEIMRNLGVIFTKNALGYDRQKQYYSPNAYSFINHGPEAEAYTYTYNYINRNSVSSGYRMIYRDMIAQHGSDLRSDEAYITSYLTKANEGTISRYPYEIGKAINIADTSYSIDAVIDYDQTRSPKQRLIGWYCLSDSMSPVVREVMGLGGTQNSLYRGVYSSSPNDVKNNYYLFSNGGCFYSGINLAKADQGGQVEEMKLFVNTIYAARKATESRTVTPVPVVEITKPSTDSVIITAADLTGGNYQVAFELRESGTKMRLDIQFGDDEEPDGSWDDTVYEYLGYGTLGPAISTDAGYVFESGKTYAVLIPANVIPQSPKELRISATNTTGHMGTDTVSIALIQPPIVTIVDPQPVSSHSALYLYVDIDQLEEAANEDYLNTEPPQRVVFEVTGAMTPTVTLGFYSGSESLTDGGEDDIEVKLLTDSGAEVTVSPATAPTASEASYALYIPAAFIKNRNVRELRITATDTAGAAGEATVILQRRSLFPLD
jgi:hypothetical protein